MVRRAATATQLTVWRRGGYELRLYDAGTDDEGREVLRYVFHDLGWSEQSGRRLFVGGDYRPSPMHSVDGPESIAGLLSFLSLREGDTDRDYFDGYDERQLAWRDSERCELLQLIVHEMEEGDGEE